MTDSTDHPAAPWPDDARLRPEQLLEHVDWVRRLAVRLTSDEHGADDLVQSTFLAAIRRPPRAGGGSIRGWLARVLTNEARSGHRVLRQQRAREEDVARERGSATDDPAEIERRFALHRSLVMAVDALDEPQRTAIVLRYFEELPPRRIAERLGEPLRTIETRLHRARAKLRQLLDSEYGTRRSWAALALPAVSSLPVTPTLGVGLALMSTKTFLAIGACIGALVLGLRLLPGEHVPADVGVASAADDADVTTLPLDLGSPSTSSARAAIDDVTSAAERSDNVLPGTPMCTVRGTVLDVAGEPLVGVDVTLAGHEGWREGVAVPRLPGREPKFGFATKTAEDGTFTIEAPVPTVNSPLLSVLPDPYHDLFRHYFRAEDAPLIEGVRDFGELRLVPTGALSGHVADRDGAPVEGVRVSVRAAASARGYHRYTWTDAMGDYSVDHVPPGMCELEAVHEGHVTAVSTPHGIEVERSTGPVDLVLEESATITGIVLDDLGAPVDDAGLGAFPASGRSGGANTRSGADGRFTLHLPDDVAYRLYAVKEGYAVWGDLFRGPTYRGGTTDLTITLDRAASLTFAIVDAGSGLPIERFGLSILAGGGSEGSSTLIPRGRSRPTLEDRPGGHVQHFARGDIDAYVAVADGYRFGAGDVVLDEGSPDTQTIRLHRGTTLTGRVVHGGEPVPRATVVIAHGNVPRKFERRRKDRPGPTLSDFRPDKSTRMTMTAGSDGRFEFTGLEAGFHALRVRSTDGLVADVFPIDVGDAEESLGDVEVVARGSISGIVLVPDGFDRSGVTVELDWPSGAAKSVTDADGRFRFDAVPPGEHTVQMQEREGWLAATEPIPVVVVAGADSSVEIDARDRGMVEMELTVLINGQPAVDYQIHLSPAASDARGSRGLGTCDAEGRVRGWVRAWGEASVGARLPGLTGLSHLAHPSARLSLVVGVPVRQTIRFELTSVALRLPAGVDYPADGRLSLNLKPVGGGQRSASLSIPLAGDRPTSEFEGVFDAAKRTVTVPFFPPGPHQLQCLIFDKSTDDMTHHVLSDGSHMMSQPIAYDCNVLVDAKLGETITVDL